MNNSKCCGSDVIIYSTIITLLLSSTLTPERKEFIGNLLQNIGQGLITAESACDICNYTPANNCNTSPIVPPAGGFPCYPYNVR